mmetsp:Transcript_39250/g.114649  ORF Transcript_39250/g.114649 Transcript_39250/m.114649 type:complete len:260 (+) Transcript_39250:667-1446(+)
MRAKHATCDAEVFLQYLNVVVKCCGGRRHCLKTARRRRGDFMKVKRTNELACSLKQQFTCCFQHTALQFFSIMNIGRQHIPPGRIQRLQPGQRHPCLAEGVRTASQHSACKRLSRNPEAWIGSDLRAKCGSACIQRRRVGSTGLSSSRCRGRVIRESSHGVLGLAQYKMCHATEPRVAVLFRLRKKLLAHRFLQESRSGHSMQPTKHECELKVAQLPRTDFDRGLKLTTKQEECRSEFVLLLGEQCKCILHCSRTPARL